MTDPEPTDRRRRLGARTRTSRPIPNKGRVLLIALVALLFIGFLSARGIARFVTDIMWFGSLGYRSAFFTVLWVKVGLAAAFTLIAGVIVWANLAAAERIAPPVVGSSAEEMLIRRFRELMRQAGGRLKVGVAALFGMVAGLPVANEWRKWLLFMNGQSFGTKDPVFDKDIGFYVFQLPFEAFLLDWLFAVAVVTVLVTAAVHFLNGGIRLQPGGRRVTSAVKLHISLLLAGLAVLKAAGYWLNRYRLLGSTRGYVNGAGFTDVKAQLPAIQLLLMISLLAAGLLIYNVRQRGWRLPILSVGLWLVVALVAGEIYPAFVQRFRVQPAESARERLYIERNIEATRQAYQLDAVDVRSITGASPTGAELASAASVLGNARLLDGASIVDAFKNAQGLTGSFKFNDAETGSLDVDRYPIEGTNQQVVVAVRELNPRGVSATWENLHLEFRHGYGVVVADGDRVTANGEAIFLPNDGSLKLDRPQVYVGEGMTGYAVVRTDRAARPQDDASYQEGFYEGLGGVKLNSRVRRIAFALRFGEWNLWASNFIGDESRIIYQRDVLERVRTLAPFLQFNSDPHAVVYNGRIKWLVDGFTTSDRYPYSQLADTSDLPARSGLRAERFNYVRNSVKAVVDAYDGTVDFYVIDEEDPIARAYQRAFPSLLRSDSELPEGLNRNFRFPLDLFQVQTQTWSRYRVDDPAKFYNRDDDTWAIAQAPPREQQSRVATTTIAPVPGAAGVTRIESDDQQVDPYYTLFPAVREGAPPDFVAMQTYVPFSENNLLRTLAAYVTASSEPATYGQLRVTEVSLRPPGPFLVASAVSQQFSAQLTPLDQQGSRVKFGDLQLLPVGTGIVWVRPWFLITTGTTNVPRLESVSVTVGDRSYRGPTLAEALRQAAAGAAVAGVTPVEAGGGTVESLLADAERLRKEAEDALKQSPPLFDVYRVKIAAAYDKAAEAARLATGRPIAATPPTISGTSTTVSSTTIVAASTTAAAASVTTVAASTTAKA